MTNEEAVERLRHLVDTIKNSEWYRTNWMRWDMELRMEEMRPAGMTMPVDPIVPFDPRP